MYVLKSRGMAHSNQIREFLISNHGVDVVDAYIGPSGVLTGSARAAQEALEKAALLAGLAAERGEVTAEVTSAHPLTDDQLVALAAKLQAREGRTVKLRTPSAFVQHQLAGPRTSTRRFFRNATHGNATLCSTRTR